MRPTSRQDLKSPEIKGLMTKKEEVLLAKRQKRINLQRAVEFFRKVKNKNGIELFFFDFYSILLSRSKKKKRIEAFVYPRMIFNLSIPPFFISIYRVFLYTTLLTQKNSYKMQLTIWQLQLNWIVKIQNIILHSKSKIKMLTCGLYTF